jgi:hypothetical protein
LEFVTHRRLHRSRRGCGHSLRESCWSNYADETRAKHKHQVNTENLRCLANRRCMSWLLGTDEDKGVENHVTGQRQLDNSIPANYIWDKTPGIPIDTLTMNRALEESMPGSLLTSERLSQNVRTASPKRVVSSHKGFEPPASVASDLRRSCIYAALSSTLAISYSSGADVVPLISAGSTNRLQISSTRTRGPEIPGTRSSPVPCGASVGGLGVAGSSCAVLLVVLPRARGCGRLFALTGALVEESSPV